MTTLAQLQHLPYPIFHLPSSIRRQIKPELNEWPPLSLSIHRSALNPTIHPTLAGPLLDRCPVLSYYYYYFHYYNHFHCYFSFILYSTASTAFPAFNLFASNLFLVAARENLEDLKLVHRELSEGMLPGGNRLVQPVLVISSTITQILSLFILFCLVLLFFVFLVFFLITIFVFPRHYCSSRG